MFATSICLYAYTDMLCMFVLLGIALVSTGYGYKEKTNLIITWNLLCQGIYFILDFLRLAFDGKMGVPIALGYIANILYLLMGVICGYSWFILVELLLNKSIFDKKTFHLHAAVPIFVTIILLIVTIPTGIVFSIDASHHIVEGPVLHAIYIIAAIYLIISLVEAYRHGSRLKQKVVFSRDSALIIFAIPPIIGVVLQLFFSGIPFIAGGITFSMVYLYTNIIHEQSSNQAEILADLSDDFVLIFKADMITNEIIVYRGEEFYEKITASCGSNISYNRLVMVMANEYIFEEDRELFLDSFSRNHITVALAVDPAFTVVVRDKFEHKYYQIRVVHPNKNMKSSEIMFGIHLADEDIRREKEIQAELAYAKNAAEIANKTKSNFLFNMSHDIRTPMNAILGFTDLAKRHIDDTARVEDCLDKVSSSGGHLLSLINDVLDMSRIESGKVAIECAPINVAKSVEDVKAMVSDLAKDNLIDLQVSIENITDENIYADILHVNEVLLNLISNAIKYTERGGHVEFITRQIGSQLGVASFEFIVKDNGIGMTPEFLEHIFDAFEREKNSTISGIQGTGLGMSITKKLVDMMNGNIDIKSTKGVGTTIKVRLDFEIFTGDISEFEKSSEDTIKEYDLNGKKILLVDDNELNRELAIELLSEAGATVEEAVNGEDAIEVYTAKDPGYYDLILMDVQMPKMNGYEATEAIRKLPNTQHANIPIIAMTANAFQEDIDEAIEHGMSAHLAKPINVEKLLSTLSTFLEE